MTVIMEIQYYKVVLMEYVKRAQTLVKQKIKLVALLDFHIIQFVTEVKGSTSLILIETILREAFVNVAQVLRKFYLILNLMMINLILILNLNFTK